jgi:pimeloyl-ACP methyl ester carboxylesterase
MEIDRREPVQLGESTQWIRIRAANTRNPLLLLVQQGPGLPMINEARTFERVLSLADDFMVIYWDQRGCGRSLRSANAPRELSIQTMVSDTERLLAMLCDRFDRPAVVAGFSMGATLAALATARRPDLVATLVTVGMDINAAAAGKSAYEFALATAQAGKVRRAIRQLQAIAPPPHLEPKEFATLERWAANFGLFCCIRGLVGLGSMTARRSTPMVPAAQGRSHRRVERRAIRKGMEAAAGCRTHRHRAGPVRRGRAGGRRDGAAD